MNAASILGLLAIAAPSPSYQTIIDRAIDRAVGQRTLPIADDATFLRRISIDLCGVVPDAKEVEAFLSDARKDKRPRKIDELTARPCAAEAFASTWSAVLLGTFEPLKERRINRTLFGRWLGQVWAKDRPWDQVATELITATGSPDLDGPVNFILSHNSPEELNGDISRIFMGVSIQCAECHDHPEQNITRRDFWEMEAFFSRTQFKIEKQEMIPKNALENLSPVMAMRLEKQVEKQGVYRRPVISDRTFGEIRIPDGDLVRPKFLSGEKPPRGDGHVQRTQLASYVTSKETGWFARALVNRLWAQYLGRGLAESVDDIGLDKCATNGKDEKPPFALLCQLSRELEANGHRVRALVRGILASKAYQAETSKTVEIPAEAEALAIRQVKPLSPEQLYATFLQVTGAEKVFDPGPVKRMELKERVLIGLGQLFGEDDDKKNVTPVATVPLSLTLMNGDLLNRAIRPHPGGTIDRMWKDATTDEARLRRLFVTALGRPPHPDESARYLAALSGLERRPRLQKEVYSDMLWAMINSTEFLYNH
jgi:hypothetical protein